RGRRLTKCYLGQTKVQETAMNDTRVNERPRADAVAQPAAPARQKGPRVWLDMDQQELDDAYDQMKYAANAQLLNERRSLDCAQGSVNRNASLMVRPKSRILISTARADPMRRSRSLSMAAPGARAGRPSSAHPQNCL